MATHDTQPLGGLLLALCIAGTSLSATAAPPPIGSRLSFVACPIARDTGPDTDLCFFAEYEGERYALVNQPDWGAMQLKHRVLVEATVADGPPVCGATPLDARISIFFELDESCQTVVPFDGAIRGQPGGIFNRGSAEQREAARELARRVETEPALSLVPVMGESSYPRPVPPYKAETLMIYYPFESDRATDGDMKELLRLRDVALAVPAHVKVTGHRGASRLTNGETIVERPEMARRRAEKIVGVLEGLGIDSSQIEMSSTDAPEGDTGNDDWRGRRVELSVVPLRPD
jgi:outer membrane protein OmpA-like peptidoglycan-associated protein